MKAHEARGGRQSTPKRARTRQGEACSGQVTLQDPKHSRNGGTRHTRAKRQEKETMVNTEKLLEVSLHGKLAGTLRKTEEGLFFEYDQTYLAQPDSMPLSAQLPLTAGRSRWGKASRWFDGLLPEGEYRARVARQVSAATMSTYSMLRAIGAECAGAIEVREEGEQQRRDKERTNADEIARYIEEMERFPLRSGETRLTLSLAGAQAKFVLVKEDTGWSWPIGGYVSTHIVKPEQEKFPGLVENEHTCMEIARRAGLRAANTAIEIFGPYKALIVERFDRDENGSRIHQEDFAQALGTSRKYQKDRGPSLRDCFTRSGVGGWELWNQVMFAWLIGDEDKHTKNFSVQYGPNQSKRLAPVYDAVCTLAYPELQRGMAMRIGRADQVGEVDERAIRNEAGKCGLEGDEALGRLHALAEKVRRSMEEMKEQGWDLKFLEAAEIGKRLDAACEWDRA